MKVILCLNECDHYWLYLCVYRANKVQLRALNWRGHIKTTDVAQLNSPLTLPSMRLASKVWFIFTHTHICFFSIPFYKQERSHSWMCLCFQECVRQIYLQAIRGGLDAALNMNHQKVEGKYLTDSCLSLSLITLQSNL